LRQFVEASLAQESANARDARIELQFVIALPLFQ
jgi:hypothetical protein